MKSKIFLMSNGLIVVVPAHWLNCNWSAEQAAEYEYKRNYYHYPPATVTMELPYNGDLIKHYYSRSILDE